MITLILALVLVFGLLQIGLPWLRRRRSRSWPWARSNVQGGSIQVVRDRSGTSYRLAVSYSYTVNRETYGGTYTERCRDEDEAQGLLKSLKEFPPPVRYKPGDPSKSVMDPYRDAALDLR